jgi:hemoglobin
MIIRDVTLDEASLTRLLGAFNTRVRGNALIRPVFAAVIREPDWPRHMATIQASWSSVLFKTVLYKGKSFGNHVILDSLEPEHFVR